jgi:hypothetical protein
MAKKYVVCESKVPLGPNDNPRIGTFTAILSEDLYALIVSSHLDLRNSSAEFLISKSDPGFKATGLREDSYVVPEELK